MNRRLFLRGVGGAALAAPFLSSVYEKSAKAEGSGSPKRMVIFFTHNGCLTDKWFPAKEDGPLTADDLKSTTLAPLAPYVSKLLLPRGFRSMNGYASGQTIDPHDQAMGSKLTCATITEDSNRYATAASLDHVVAKQINPGGASPLVLSVGAASTKIKEVLSFSEANKAFPANVNPQTVYNQLTGLFSSGSTAPTEGDYRVALGESAIDLVKGDLERYQKLNMSQSDKMRIKDWLDLLRTTESGIGIPTSCSAASAMALNITDAAVKAASPSGPIDPGAFNPGGGSAQGSSNLGVSFTQGGDMMMNLMALSMICDTNRSFILVYPGYVTFNWDSITHTHDHHGLSHRTGDFTVGGACGVVGVLDMIGQIDNWYAGKYAKLVGLLDSVSEGEGKLLDNTATMWLPELSDGAAHNLNNLPIMIAGSAGGYLKQGVAVNVEGKNIGVGSSTKTCQNGGDIGNTGSFGGNVPINKLYVTLMNAVGCKDENGDKVTKFGVFDGTGMTGGITNPGEVAKLTTAG